MSNDFDLPVSRLHRPNQSTSERALERTVKSRSTMVENVYWKIREYHDGQGCIPEEIAAFYQIDLIDVRRAFSVLKKKNRIVTTGEERKNIKENWCVVWRAVKQEA